MIRGWALYQQVTCDNKLRNNGKVNKRRIVQIKNFQKFEDICFQIIAIFTRERERERERETVTLNSSLDNIRV